MQQLQSIKRVLDSLARVADLLVLPGSVDSAVQVLCVLPLKVSKLLLLLGCLLLEVWYLEVDIPHQKLAGFSKKDVCSSAQQNVSHVGCVAASSSLSRRIICSLAQCQDPNILCQPCQVCPELQSLSTIHQGEGTLGGPYCLFHMLARPCPTGQRSL